MSVAVRAMTVAIGAIAACSVALFVSDRGPSAEPALSPSEIYALLEKSMQVESGQAFFKDATYVGSQACTGCHDKQVAEWHNT